MAAVIAVAAVVRITRREGASSAGPVDSAVLSSAAPLATATGLDAPLRGPALPGAARDAASSSTSDDAGSSSARGTPRMVHGDPRHTHRGPSRGPARINVGWRTNVGGPVAAQVTSSPDGKTLYVGTLGGAVVALDRDGGAKRWEIALGDRVYSTPLVHDDGTVYVGTDAKKLVALSKDGAVLWKLEVDGEVDSGPTFGRDGTIVFAAGPNVYSVRRGGDLAWRLATKRKVYTSPAVMDDGLIVVGAQDDVVRGITMNGVLAWSTNVGADVDGAPAISDDGFVHVGTDKGEIVRLDRKGSVVWRSAVGGFVRGALSVSRSGDILAGTYGPVPRVVRITPEGTVRGARAIAGTGAREFGIHGGPLEDEEGTLFFGAQDDSVRAVGLDGVEKWRFGAGADVDAPISMLDDGSLVIASEDGTITMLLP